MKKGFVTLAAMAMVAGATFTACHNKEERVEDAKENVQDAKEELRDAQRDLNSEYPAYRTDAEQRITANEQRIAELRNKINTGGKPLDDMREQRIKDLEKRNADLRARLYGYEKERSDWEQFKREFNHDMDELGNSISDFGKDNTK
ncbi:MAG: hypothetical protein U0T75_03230 [Chitinophagales bacterium]